MSDLRKIPASDDEPKPICANCNSYQEDMNGNWWCIQGSGLLATAPSDGCSKFFPDFKRWPDADHG